MKDFLNYYQNEILFLRRHGGYFSKQYPDIAGAIDLQDSYSSDPHTEKIIESVAFMSARLHKKIDENEAVMAKHILGILYPYLINTFPSCCVASFDCKDTRGLPDCIDVPKGTVFLSKQEDGNYCTFKNLYPINIYPIKIRKIDIIGEGERCFLHVKIDSISGKMESLNLSNLLININSVNQEECLILYESLFAFNAKDVFVKVVLDGGIESIVKLPTGSLEKRGLSDGENICNVQKYTMNCYQFIQESLFFFQKFLFFSVKNIDYVLKNQGFKDVLSLTLIIESSLPKERLVKIIRNDILKLHTVPLVNLFEVTSDPIKFMNNKSKFLLLADQKKDKNIEIQDILSIHIIEKSEFEDKIIQPYFSLEIDSDTNCEHNLFWISEKESAEVRKLDGVDTYISIIDTDIDLNKEYDDVIYAKTLCTNRFSARELPIGTEMIAEGVSTGEYKCLISQVPTPPKNFIDDSKNMFALVSQLACSNISITQNENILNYIRKLLNTLAGGNSFQYEKMLSNISEVKTKSIVRRIGNQAWRGFVKGTEIQFFVKDPSQSFWTFFLVTVLNELFSSIVTINSFVEIVILSHQLNKELARLAPSSGRQDLI